MMTEGEQVFFFFFFFCDGYLPCGYECLDFYTALTYIIWLVANGESIER